MTTRLNRQTAGARAKIAQAAMGVLVVGGGAALAVGLRIGPKAETPPAAPTITVPEVTSNRSGPRSAIDSAAVAVRLNQVSNHPTPVEAAPAPKVGEAAPPPPPTPPPAELRYLGAVMGGNNMALISDAGKQRFVGVGDKIGESTVESISATEIRVSGATPRTIALADRAGDVLTRGHRAAGGQAAAPGVQPGQPGAQGKPHQLASQGLTSVNKPAPSAPQQPFVQQPGVAGGEEIPPTPQWIRPDVAQRFDELREKIRGSEKGLSEHDVMERATKLMINEDPKAVDVPVMEKMRALEDQKRKEQKN